jgi:hypothetical protein
MSQPEFEIAVRDGVIDVRHEVSKKSPRGRFYAGLFFLTVMVLALCAALFLPEKHGRPSMWHDLSTSPVDSSDFIAPLIIIFVVVGGSSWMCVRYLFVAYPSDETLYCDRSILRVSKVPWFDLRNAHWITRSYPLNEISEVRFAAIASLKNITIRGLRFVVSGKKLKVLPGLEAPEADQILKALEAFGVNVVGDPDMATKIAESLANR